uniref:Golgi to ER traffic protein 4 homolog n=1 Tax=Cacopsylla melanoneura TaxID=428564 RepID=A0A8D8S2I1_9HEMI
MESSSAAPSPSSNSSGVSRVLNKLRNSVNDGNYYEAHQMYRTLYFRYLNQKKYADLLALLFDGAEIFFEKDQEASGIDLTQLIIDTLVKSGTEGNSDNQLFSKLTKLLGRIRPDNPQRGEIISSALKWSKSVNNVNNKQASGDPGLHECIANMFWRENNFVLARYHFLHSSDGRNFALMLIQVHRERGYANEIDLFIAQTFENYTTKHPNIRTSGPPYYLPLLNFIWFLLKVIETGKLVAFNTLCQQYQTSIKRDPAYADYLNKIGQLFFGIQPARPAAPVGGGFFGNILSSLMNNLEEGHDFDDEEDNEPTSLA